MNFAKGIRQNYFILFLLAFKQMNKWIVLGHFTQWSVRNDFFVKWTLNFLIIIRINLLDAFFTKRMTTSQDHRLSFLQIIIFQTNRTLQNSDLIFSWFVISIVISQIFFFQRYLLVPVEKFYLSIVKKLIWIFNFLFVWVCIFYFFLRKSIAILKLIDESIN